ncbi:MAG: transcription antitermination factor NusB, partial [Alphaproteobacteria bacterium]|nr:transcription antitermination factor NusB [Alphaproteobacteria bacterium]
MIAPIKPEKLQDSPRAAAAPRAIALDLVSAVLRKGRLLDEALAPKKWISGGDSGRDSPEGALDGLSSRDRAFVRLLVTTVLRRLGQVDAVIGHYLERPLPRQAAESHDIMRLGAAQLLFLKTPPHAAVDTAVEMTRARGFTPHLKLVNAVLRRMSREGAALVEPQDAPRLNTPDWLWKSWTATYGEEMTRAIATVHLAEPPLDLSVAD